MVWDYESTIARAKTMDMNKVEIVTPDMAREWLSLTAGNRNVTRRHVSNLVAEMDRGNWDVRLPAYIIFDILGRLINGHHRLKAVILHGLPVPMRVLRGADEDLKKKLDAITKPRSPADQFVMAFGETSGKRKVALTKGLVELEDVKIVSHSDLTADDLYEVFTAEREHIDAVMRGYNFKHVRGQRVLSAIAYARPVFKDKADRFLDQLTSMQGTSPSVASLLRYLPDASANGGPASARVISLATLRALVADAYESHIKLLRTTVNGTISGELTSALDHVRALRAKAGIKSYRDMLGMETVEPMSEAAE